MSKTALAVIHWRVYYV